MATPKHIKPGFPANKAVPAIAATVRNTGAIEVPPTSPLIAGLTQFTPNKTFNYAMPGGGTMSFYEGLPKVIPAYLRTRLMAAGFDS